jgi:hypothetical protein
MAREATTMSSRIGRLVRHKDTDLGIGVITRGPRSDGFGGATWWVWWMDGLAGHHYATELMDMEISIDVNMPKRSHIPAEIYQARIKAAIRADR